MGARGVEPTAEEKAVWAEMKAAGKTIAEIAAWSGKSYQTVAGALRPPRAERDYERERDRLREEWWSLVDAGVMPPQIAERTGYTEKAVKALLAETPDGRARWLALLRRLHDEGMTQSGVAARVGTSRQNVRRLLGPARKDPRTEVRRVHVRPGTFAAVDRVAAGLRYRKPGSDEGSLSGLLEGIAADEVDVRRAGKGSRRPAERVAV